MRPDWFCADLAVQAASWAGGSVTRAHELHRALDRAFAEAWLPPVCLRCAPAFSRLSVSVERVKGIEPSTYSLGSCNSERGRMKELTSRQRRFAEEYLIDLNASAAARRAGYAQNSAHEGVKPA
jgi:hypothetical protein